MAESSHSTSSMAAPVRTRGIHHLGLTVPDHQKLADFFCRALNYQIVGGVPDYPATFVSDGCTMLTLWQAKSADSASAFDRHHNIGLHHFALAVGDRRALASLYGLLQDEPDVVIEFAPERLGTTRIEHMMCIVPGGLRIEFITDR